jgi:tRNA-splicing ligase RtcB
MAEQWNGPLEKIDDYRWMIPRSYQKGMRVPGLIYADEKMIDQVRGDQAPQQVANVAHLPGLLGYSLAMPDIHWGYGFPIGGVAGIDVETGVVSPGGVGYDINCGVRLVRTSLSYADIKDRIRELVERLFQNIPCGLGSTSKLKLSRKEERTVLRDGPIWAIKQGFGWNEDVELTEQKGRIEGADPDALSERALIRGKSQLGTLGSGNHFLEIQEVMEIFDEKAARAFGLEKGQITVMIHTGSRGLGYQVCDDNLDRMVKAMIRFDIQLPDKQLACAPISSHEGRQYLAGMAAAANYAWTNRQIILHWVRETFEQVLAQPAERIGLHMVYDVAHNIAKLEEHTVESSLKQVLVHRKGATRAFPAGHPDLPEKYRSVGQPVIIPGDMGTASYVLAGTQKAMEESFGSTCHGAGRVMSRHAAIRLTRGRSILQEMESKGIVVRSKGRNTLFEEASEAYKDIDQVVDIVHGAGLSRKVVRMRPLGVVKG